MYSKCTYISSSIKDLSQNWSGMEGGPKKRETEFIFRFFLQDLRLPKGLIGLNGQHFQVEFI